MHAQWAETDVSVHHYRDGSSEIDIVLESRSGDITAIEVKASASLDAASRGAHEEVERSRPKPSRCRIAHNRRTRKSSKEIRDAVSDGAEVFVAG